MIKSTLATIALTVAVGTTALSAEPATTAAGGTDTVAATNATPVPDRATDALLTSIITWLSSNFDLQPTANLPRVNYVAASTITERRHRAFLGAGGPPLSEPETGRSTVALYDLAETTIYLPNHWSAAAPADVSVLVHELVHHLQHMAMTKFECPQAREQLAYAAQQRWLGLYGRNLEDEFQLDPFTLLVTTRCMY